MSELRPAPASGTAVECVVDIGTLAAARQAVERFARAHGLEGDGLRDLVLAANELAINAVRHGGGRGTVWCQVRDEGPGIPDAITSRGRTSPSPSASAIEGRGLWLVHRMTATTIIETGPEGTTVTIAAAVTSPRGGRDHPAQRAMRRTAKVCPMWTVWSRARMGGYRTGCGVAAPRRVA